MSRQPIISRNIPAHHASIERIIGPALAKRYLPNPALTEYAYVFRFLGSKVVTSRRLQRVLAKVPTPAEGAILLAGEFTIEALALAAEAACDVVSEQEPFWTDGRYVSRREPP